MGRRCVRAGAAGFARVGAIMALSLALAHCGKSPTSKVDPKYGVSASARVVEPGEPVPKGGGTYRVGKPYVIAGQTYTPEENSAYSATGIASWYGEDFHGRLTANGEIFDMQSVAAAHPTLPLPSYARVTNLRNNRSLVVRVNDRGPFHAGRVIDVSVRAARLLGFYEDGTTRVRVDYVGRASLSGSDDVKLASTLRHNDRSMPARAPAPPPVAVASNKPFAAEYFDPRPLTQRSAPAPSARPQPAAAPSAVATAEKPASFESRFGSAGTAPVGVVRTEPVSAFAPGAPARADGGVLSGRGLY